MKKLPIIIMLSAAGITGAAMAGNSMTGTSNGASTEVGKDLGSYGQTSGASGSRVSGTNGAASTSGMNGAAGTNGYGKVTGTNGAAAGTVSGKPMKSPTGGVNGGSASTDIGQDLGSYGKTSGASGSQVSPAYGKQPSGTQTRTNGAAGGTMMQNGSGASSVTWSCPPGYTLSTATRDGTPLCYPNTGPMPGGSR